MQLAVVLSMSLRVVVVAVPFLQPVFNTHWLSWNEWLVVLGLALVPATAEELTKLFLRRHGSAGAHPSSGALRQVEVHR